MSTTGNTVLLAQRVADEFKQVRIELANAGGGGSADTGDITFVEGTMFGSQGMIRSSVVSTTTTGNYNLTAGVDYSTAVWDGDAVIFNDTTQALYDAINATGGQFDLFDLQVNGVLIPVTSVGSSTPGAPLPLTLYLDQTAVGGPLNVTALQIETRSGSESYMEIDGTDLRIEVQDDVRIIGSDLFLLSNVSPTRAISIETDDGGNTWEFGADGHLILPTNGEIRDTNGINLLASSSFSGDYNDLTNKPDLSVYATTTALSTAVSDTQLALADKANSADVYTITEVDDAIAAATGGGGGTRLPGWNMIVENVATTGGLVLPNGLTWDTLKQTYQELGFHVITTNDGTTGMSALPVELLPNTFRPFVTLGSTTLMLCNVQNSAVGNYILSLGANCRFSLYGRGAA